MKRVYQRLVCLGLLTLTTFLVGGCKSDDELTERPWNNPRSWESGLPSAITEGR
jgi:hypothetical protein